MLRCRRFGGVAALAAALGLAGGGCAANRFPDAVPAGVATATANLGEQTRLGDDLVAYFRPEGPETVTVVLVPRGDAVPDQVTILRLMWRAKAAATPLDKTATNTAVRHLVFGPPAPPATDRRGEDGAAESLGVFSGGGFVKLRGDLAGSDLEFSLEEADLRLTDASPDYDHPRRRTRLSGRVQARRDDAAVTRWITDSRVRAAAALGYPSLVGGPGAGEVMRARAKRGGAVSSTASSTW